MAHRFTMIRSLIPFTGEFSQICLVRFLILVAVYKSVLVLMCVIIIMHHIWYDHSSFTLK